MGTCGTFTAICADSKLVPCWYIGRRDIENATVFMNDLAGRMKNRVQLTTDPKIVTECILMLWRMLLALTLISVSL